jgi:hypothetical protein
MSAIYTMDTILDARFPSRFRFYRIPIKHRAPIVFLLIYIPTEATRDEAVLSRLAGII